MAVQLDTSRSLDEKTTVESSTVIRRSIAVVGMCGIALIHVLDLEDKFEEVTYIGWLFVALSVVSLVVAEALIRGDNVLAWLAAAVLAGSTIVAYCLSRTVGLPGEGDEEVGKWFGALGLSSLVVEGVVLLVAVGRLTQSRVRTA